MDAGRQYAPKPPTKSVESTDNTAGEVGSYQIVQISGVTPRWLGQPFRSGSTA